MTVTPGPCGAPLTTAATTCDPVVMSTASPRLLGALLLSLSLAGCPDDTTDSDSGIDASRDAPSLDGSVPDTGSIEDAPVAHDDALHVDGGTTGDGGTDGGTDGGLDASTPAFIPGETMPYYEVTEDFSGEHNVGNLPGVALTPYSGSVGCGVIRLPSGTYENIDFGDCLLDIRGVVVMNNCRGVLRENYDDSIGEHIRILNGATTTSVELNDCEFHNRTQRILDGLKGRNFVVNRSVFTGYVDGIDNASPGSAPQLTGGEIHDSWIGDLAWWRAETNGIVHPSDTQSHNDGSQVTMGLGILFENTFFGAWASDYVGTGTPGSGSEANPYDAPYIRPQATMDTWRTMYLNRLTRPDQSWDGVAHRLPTGGSFAAIMGNASNGMVDHCWFSGGTVAINLLDASVTSGTWSVRRSTFWNDMSGGRPLDSTSKGVAIFLRADRTYDVPTTGPDANHWFDGTVVMPNRM